MKTRERFEARQPIVVVDNSSVYFHCNEEEIVTENELGETKQEYEYDVLRADVPCPDESNILSAIKNLKIVQIKDYDASDKVNIFFLNGVRLWLDKATRVGLNLRFAAEKASGREYTTLWHDTLSFSFPIDTAIEMLNHLEGYASASYDVTHAHIAAVSELTSIEDILSYDNTLNYPNILDFNY